MCHCVIVKTPKGELTLQDDYAKFMQEYNQAKGLKVGAEVTGSLQDRQSYPLSFVHWVQRDVTRIAR